MLIINQTKTNAMFFTNNTRSVNSSPPPMIKLNGLQVHYVSKFKLLGVLVDNLLKFDLHTISVCHKVNLKVRTLRKCTFMFGNKFKVIIFKMFILSSFEYCSTLFFHLSNQVDAYRMEKIYSKACYLLLNTRLSNQCSKMVNNVAKTVYVAMDLKQQTKTLSSLNLMPLKLRFLYHFVSFLFSNLIRNSSCNLMIRILSFKKTSENNRLTNFKMPLFNKNLYKLTFTSISIKFLNLYLYNQFILVSHDPSNSTIKLRIADFKLFHKNICNLVDIQERFTRSLNSWM